MAHILQVVVLARNPKTGLGVGHAQMGGGREAQKYVFKWVHPRVGKQQCGVAFDHQRRGLGNVVPLAAKKVQEFLANLFG